MIRPSKIQKDLIPYVEYLENQLKTPFVDSFLALKKMSDSITKQVLNVEIDIFNPEDEKKSAMVSKSVLLLKEYSEQMIYFKSKMTKEEVVDVDKKALDDAPALERQVFKGI